MAILAPCHNVQPFSAWLEAKQTNHSQFGNFCVFPHSFALRHAGSSGAKAGSKRAEVRKLLHLAACESRRIRATGKRNDAAVRGEMLKAKQAEYMCSANRGAPKRNVAFLRPPTDVHGRKAIWVKETPQTHTLAQTLL